MPRLVAAPDKFRRTATASEAAAAIARAAITCGWEATTRPMSDGGEGFVEVLGSNVRHTVVQGPLGSPVTARWSLLDDGTAILEAAEAVGRALLTEPRGNDPVTASTSGVGELVAAAAAAGATSIVVGCGGTSSTDGGLGLVEALDDRGLTISVPIVAACDVDVAFVEAAQQFGPQKGATPAQVELLERRLEGLVVTYLDRFGVDVTRTPGAGAAGGLAGGLVALGATVVSGAAYVAAATGLDASVATADLVVTGEGRLDRGTLSGKVVRRVLAARSDVPALLVVGGTDEGVVDELRATREGTVKVVVLDQARQRSDGTVATIADAVRRELVARGSARSS